jgi:hypothetical protein
VASEAPSDTVLLSCEDAKPTFQRLIELLKAVRGTRWAGGGRQVPGAAHVPGLPIQQPCQRGQARPPFCGCCFPCEGSRPTQPRRTR